MSKGTCCTSSDDRKLFPRATSRRLPESQRGVVLVVALVMLVVVSVIVSVSMRNATSTESASGTVRTTELAFQAAEIALKTCEDAVTSLVETGKPLDGIGFTAANVLPAGSATHWESPAHWDSKSTETFVLPLPLLNDKSPPTTYKRPPECMVAPLPVMLNHELTLSDSTAYVVTARGFGPEVASGTGRPEGTEVWLQSHVTFR